jgi:hypothetical protein
VSWSDPRGERDPPNTRVRGHPALLWEHTVAANNLDHVMLGWHEPAERGVVPPLSGVFVSIEAHPRHHSVDDVRSYAERLTRVA